MFYYQNNLIFCYNGKYYKFAKIEVKHDGSIYLFLPRNPRYVTKKISIHSSGRVNYDTPDKHINFIENLTQITQPSPIVGIFIPDLSFLECIEEPIDKTNNIIIGLPIDNQIMIDILISNSIELMKQGNPFISVNIIDNLKLIIGFNHGKYDERCQSKIRWYYPKDGSLEKTSINKYEAKKMFSDVLYEQPGFKIIGPNEDGKIELIFDGVMAAVPVLEIELEDPDQYVKPIVASRVNLIFEIRNKKRGNQVVKNPKYIKIVKAIISCEGGIDDYPDCENIIKFYTTW